MTIDQFLDRLRETPGRWTLHAGHRIRHEDQCPITRVAGRDQCAHQVTNAANALGLTIGDRTRIIYASDCIGHYDRTLRDELLIATGLHQRAITNYRRRFSPKVVELKRRVSR